MAYPGEYIREELGEDGYVGDRGYGYGAESYGRPEYGAEGYEHHKHHHHHRPEYLPGGYAPEGYPGGYPPQQPQVVYVETPQYMQPGGSDLGMGLVDSNYNRGSEYVAGYGGSQLGYGAAGYGESAENERLREELRHETKRAHEAELAAAAVGAYGLYERHEKRKDEDELERFEPHERRHHHHLFSRD